MESAHIRPTDGVMIDLSMLGIQRDFGVVDSTIVWNTEMFLRFGTKL